MSDPYRQSDGNDPIAPATSVDLVTPSDTVDLAYASKALRIYNPGDAGAAVVGISAAGGSFTILLNTGVNIEPIRATRIMATGTDGGLTIHALTDRPYPASGSE